MNKINSNKDYIYLAINKNILDEVMQDKKEFSQEELKNILLQGVENYKARNKNKKTSSIYANNAKRAISNYKCITAIKKMIYNKEPITPYKLSKASKASYNTAKRFIEQYEEYFEINKIMNLSKLIMEEIEKYVKDKTKLYKKV